MNAPRRFSWNSKARVAYPRWKSVFGIELSVVVVIIAVAAAALIGSAQLVLAKTRMVDALHAMHVGKIAVVEHNAITGRALATDMLGEERRADGPAAPEYERHLSAAAAFAAVASASGQKASKSDGLEDTSAYYARAGVVDGSVVGIGRVRGVEGTYRMTLMPMDLAGGGPVLLWACGAAPPPAGYVLVGARTQDRIAPELLIYPCRMSRPW